MSERPAEHLQPLQTPRSLHHLAWSAVAILFAPLLLPLALGRMFALDDLSAFHLPVRYLYQSALVAGDSVIWTSKMFGGFYLHAEGQVGAMHPLHLVLYALLPLTTAFDIEIILSYLFGFWGMWSLLRRWGLSAIPRIGGAIAFAFSGFAVLHLPHMNAIAVTAHVPWLVLAIDLGLSDDLPARRRGRAGVAMLLGSQILLGYPQYVWMSGIVIGLYLLAHRAVRAWRRVFGLLLAGATGVLVGGVQLLPTLDLLRDSVRRTVAEGFNVSFSLHPLNLVQFVSPYVLVERVFAAPEERFIHEFGLYSGALAVLCVIWALLRRRSLPASRLAFFAGVTCAVGLLLALGRYGGVYTLLGEVPLVSKFRAPTRHIMLVHFGLALLIGIVLEDLWRRSYSRAARATPARWLWIGLALNLLVALVALASPGFVIRFDEQTLHPAGMASGAILLFVATLVFLDAVRGSRAAIVVLILFTAVDLGFWGYSYVFAGGVQTAEQISHRTSAPPAPAGSTVYELWPEIGHNVLLLRDFRVLSAYAGLPPARAAALPNREALRLAGASWLKDETGWQPVPDPAARVRLIEDSAVTEDPAAARSPAVHVELISDQPGQMVVDVRTDRASVLVTTERYHEGWRARSADGQPTAARRVYDDYLGVTLAPGSYRLTLTFDPVSFRRGKWMSVAGLAATVLLFLLPRRWSRSVQRRQAVA